MDPLLSIIVPVHSTKRFQDVVELLDSIKRQTYKKIETVLVCDTEQVLRQLLEHVRAIRMDNVKVILTQHGAGASLARNLGASIARGEILSFLDDDVILVDRWAEEVVRTFKNEDVVGVTGQTIPILGKQPIDWVPTEFKWVLGGTFWHNDTVNVQSVAGMNVSFRRHALEVAGLYNIKLGPRRDYPETANWKRLGGEEAELALRIINRTHRHIVYNPGMKVYHKTRPSSYTVKAIVRRALHVGHNRAMIWHLSRGLAIDSTQTEKELLFRIITRLLPKTALLLMKKPVLAWKRFAISTLIIGCVLVGFTFGYIHLSKLIAISARKS